MTDHASASTLGAASGAALEISAAKPMSPDDVASSAIRGSFWAALEPATASAETAS